jgi:hypothetical protein
MQMKPTKRLTVLVDNVSCGIVPERTTTYTQELLSPRWFASFGVLLVIALVSQSTAAFGQAEANLTTAIRDFWIEPNKYFTADSGDVKDACIAPGGPYKLLRFDFDARNEGTADVVMSPVPPVGQSNDTYVWSEAHNHHHIRNFNNYDLVNDSGSTTLSGFKQAFCLMDVEKFDPTAPAGKFECSNQGVTRGWKDVYDSRLPCQYINITGAPDGIYSLVAETNVSRLANEGNVYDNRVAQRLSISGNSVTPLQPIWRPSVEVVAPTNQLQTPAVVARGDNRFDLFYRGRDGRLYTKWQDWSGSWSPASSLPIWDSNVPYSLVGDPAAYSAKFAWIDVFARNNNNNIYHFYWRGGPWGYYSMGGDAGGPPAAVAPSPDRGMVAVIWSDGTFRYRYWNGSLWTDWASLAGNFVKEAPTLVASGSDTIHAFFRRADGVVWYSRFVNGRLVSSASLGGNMAGQVSAASWTVDRVDVVAKGTNNSLYRKTWSAGGGFTGWIADGPTDLVSLPVVISTAPRSLDVFYYDNSSGFTTYHRRHFDGSTWTVDDPSAVARISSAVPPVVASWAHTTFALFHTLTDGSIRVRRMQ